MPNDSVSSPDVLIGAENLRCRRGGKLLFAGVSFRLKRGEALRIVGANGSGKTSLIKILCGLLVAEEGTIRAKASLHYLGHKDALADELTAAEMLLWYQSISSDTGKHNTPSSDAIFARLNLRDIGRLPCGKLSAGQRKLVCLAKLLLLPRSLWILDEPFASLAPAAVLSVRTLLNEHRASGGGLIYSDHSDFYDKTDELCLSEFVPEFGPDLTER